LNGKERSRVAGDAAVRIPAWVVDGESQTSGRGAIPTALSWIASRRQAHILVLCALFTLVYASAIADLAKLWWTRDVYSHGFLIVPISVYLAWTKRSSLRRLAPEPGSVWGLGLLLVAAALLIVGSAASLVGLESFSIVTMIVGLIAYLLGPRFVKALAFPIVYLALMLPVWEELLGFMHWPLQLIAAATGTRVLQALGVAAMLDRQYVVLPGITLEVAQACSGATYLVAIFAVALPVAYLMLTRWSSRVVLIVCAVLVGIAANSARIVFIGLWAMSGRELLHGPLEMFQAMFVAWVGAFAVGGMAWAFRALERRSLPATPARLAATPAATSDAPLRSARLTRAWVAAVGVLTLSGVCIALLHRGPVTLADLDAVPRTIDGWLGQAGDVRDAIFRMHATDQEMLRVYHNRDGDAVQVYVAYVAVETSGKKLIDHRTAVLHEGAEPLSVTLSSGQVGTINRGRLHNARSTYPVLFWYQVNGGVFADRYRAKLEIMRTALAHGRTNGALFVIAPLSSSDPATQAWPDAFAQALLRSVRAFVL
jgi:EpsI family protein